MTFRTIFNITLSLNALVGVSLAILSLLIVSEAVRRIENGRLASDAISALQSAQLNTKALIRYTSTKRAGTPTSAVADELFALIDANLQSSGKILQSLNLRTKNTVYLELNYRNQLLVRKLRNLREAWTVAHVQEAGNDRATNGVLSQLQSFLSVIEGSVRADQNVLADKRRDADTALSILMYIAILSALTFVLVAFASSIVINRRLKPQLNELENSLNDVRSGNLQSRARIVRYDEFGKLAQIFNYAIETLEINRNRAALQRDMLQKAVDERTHELSRALSEMESSAKQREKLLSEIGHELRTPLTIIRGEAEVALKGKRLSRAEQLRILETVQEASVQLMMHLDDLSNLARASDPSLKMRCVEAGVDEVVANTLKLVKHLTKRLQVNLNAEGITCFVDPLRLQQAILVLLDNASHYSPSDTKIYVSTSLEGGFWYLQIADEGLGLTNEEMQSIFDRGYRSQGARALRPSGLGYGLSIAENLVRKLNGSLIVASDGPNTGTRFTISLPTIKAKEQDDPRSAD